MEKKYRILAIEDEPLVWKALEFRLNKEGYSVAIATDGRAGLDALALEYFDLVITDLMLPEVNGMDIVKEAKKQDPTRPVIVLSSMGMENILLQAFQLGANDFMTKPFSPTELAVRVQRFLK